MIFPEGGRYALIIEDITAIEGEEFREGEIGSRGWEGKLRLSPLYERRYDYVGIFLSNKIIT